MSEVVCVLVTVSSAQEGRTIAQGLLESHLAACVKIVPGVESHYWWQGKLEHSAELQLLIKTRAVLLPSVISRVKQLHSYAVPEVLALPVTDGNPDYLAWVRNETASASA